MLFGYRLLAEGLVVGFGVLVKLLLSLYWLLVVGCWRWKWLLVIGDKELNHSHSV